MKKRIVAMLLAGGQGSRLGVLTSSMAKENASRVPATRWAAESGSVMRQSVRGRLAPRFNEASSSETEVCWKPAYAASRPRPA